MEETLGFGRHASKTYREVDSAYLRFLVDSGHRCAPKASAELERRGEGTNAKQATVPARGQAQNPAVGVVHHAADAAFSFDQATTSDGYGRSHDLDVVPAGATEPPAGFKLIRIDAGPRTKAYFTVAPKDPAYTCPSADPKRAAAWTESQFHLPAVSTRCRVLAPWLQSDPIEGVVEATMPLLIGDVVPRVRFKPDTLPANWPYGKERCFCPGLDELQVLRGSDWVPFLFSKQPEPDRRAA